jgi:hypothetical protein
MKYIIVALAVLLSGCTTVVPIAAKFPEAPSIIMERCPDLKKIETETTVMSILTKTVTENYTTYYECAVKVDAFRKWYETQKAIFENLN